MSSSPSTPSPTGDIAEPVRAEAVRPHPVTVHVNERAIQLPDRVATGLEIKQAAISQGVPIELDFILVQELGGGRTKVIGDGDEVHLEPSDRFLANDGDDNS